MGGGIESNKGATGRVIIRLLKGKAIAVFKPDRNYVSTVTKIKNWIKQTFGGQLYFLSQKNDAQSQAEVAAYRLDRHFGFNLSPPVGYNQNGLQERGLPGVSQE